MEQSQSADCSLLKPEWASLEPDEFRVLLEDRIGGPGQITGDSGFYLPLAGPNCQVVLQFEGTSISKVEAGPAFDAKQWEDLSSDIDRLLHSPPSKVGRNIALGEHPFILEFPLHVRIASPKMLPIRVVASREMLPATVRGTMLPSDRVCGKRLPAPRSYRANALASSASLTSSTSKLYERVSLIVTTNLTFGEWSNEAFLRWDRNRKMGTARHEAHSPQSPRSYHGVPDAPSRVQRTQYAGLGRMAY